MQLVGHQEEHQVCKKSEWWQPGMVICLQQGADLHMAQLMPLPLNVSCFSKIQISFTFLVPAHPGSPGKKAIKHVCKLTDEEQLIHCHILHIDEMSSKPFTGRTEEATHHRISYSSCLRVLRVTCHTNIYQRKLMQTKEFQQTSLYEI